MKRLIFLTVPFLFFACAIPVRTSIVNADFPPVPPDEEVITVNQYEKIPEGSQLVGTIEAGGFSSSEPYSEQLVLHKIKDAARQQGANVVKIIERRLDAVLRLDLSYSSCPVYTAGLFRNDSPTAIAEYHARHAANNASTLPADSDFALVHFYRESPGYGVPFRLRLRNNGATIARLGDNEKFTYKMTNNFSLQGFGAGTRHNDVVLRIEPGQEYYLRYTTKIDGGVFKPSLILVDNVVGREETKTVRPYIPRAARSSR